MPIINPFLVGSGSITAPQDFYTQTYTVTFGPLPPGKQIGDLPRAPYPPNPPYRIDQTWTQNLLLTTLAANVLYSGYTTRGHQRSLPDRGQPPRLTYYGWEWRQVGMLGQDVLPSGLVPGETVSDTTPRAPSRLPDYVWTWRQVGMLGRDVVPGDQVYDLTPKAPQRLPDYSVTWRQVGMLGQDQLPVGETVFALPVRALPLFQTWLQSLNPVLSAVPLPPGDQIYDLPLRPAPLLQTWTLSANITFYPAPFNYTVRPHLRSLPDRGPQWIDEAWTSNPLTLRTIAPVAYWVTYNLFDQPNPRAPKPIEQTWTWRQVGMLGQDKLPVGEQVYDLVPKAPQRLSDYTIAWRQVGMLGQDRLPVGEQVYDLAPKLAQRLADYSVTWRQVAMLGQDQLPVGESSFDRPVLSPQRVLDWIASTNIALTSVVQAPFAQTDWQLPQRQVWYRSWEQNLALTLPAPQLQQTISQVYDLTPMAPLRASDLRTWIQSVNVALVTAPPTAYWLTYNLFDQPNPRAPKPIEQTWTWRQVGMLGLDQLPVGEQVTDLTPKLAPRLNYYGTEWRQTGMLGQDQLPVGANVYDLAPKAAPRAPYYGAEWRQTGMLGQDRLPIGKIVQELTAHRFIPQPIEQTTAWRQVGMLGLDRLPAGAIVTALAVRAPLTAADLYSWINSVNVALNVTPAALPIGVMPGNMVYALPMRGPPPIQQPATGPYNPAFIPPPPVITALPHNLYFLADMGRLKSF